MNKNQIIELARKAGFVDGFVELVGLDGFSKFADLVINIERQKIAGWMHRQGYYASPEDDIEELIKDLDCQASTEECDFCAKICEEADPSATPAELAVAIRARG